MTTLQRLARAVLRRPFFYGQHRLFGWLFKKGYLGAGKLTIQPLTGNFSIACNTSTWIGAGICYMGDYEPATKAVFSRLVKPGNTVIDIGANIGFHTLFLAQLCGNEGKVIAIEPVAVNFQELQNNIAINNYRNIVPIQKALGEDHMETGIEADPGSINPGAYSLHSKGDTMIQVMPGDELVTTLQLEKIDLIKIDVEGYELPVLKGLKNTIQRDRPVIIFEYDKNYQSRSANPADILDLLQSFDYRLCKITNRGLVPFIANQQVSSAQLCASILPYE